jgi:hypothetical protein
MAGAGILANVSPQVQKKYQLDKPYMAQVTVDDLNNLKKALVESSASPGAPACNTCCCCCAASVTPE